MLFETVPVEAALGAILAHGVRAGGKLLRKGRVLSGEDLAAIRQAGIADVTVARLDGDDVSEDEAAARIAARLCGDHVRIGAAFTGRANLYATADGLFIVDPMQVKLARTRELDGRLVSMFKRERDRIDRTTAGRPRRQVSSQRYDQT